MKIESDNGIRPRVIGIACIYLFLGAARFLFCILQFGRPAFSGRMKRKTPYWLEIF